MAQKGNIFFTKAERYAFRDSLFIPPAVNIWIAGFRPLGKGNIISGVYTASTSPVNLHKLYVCTYAVGHFVFQLLAARTSLRFMPESGFESLAVPIWPDIPNVVIWPRSSVLLNVSHFDAFNERWKRILVMD